MEKSRLVIFSSIFLLFLIPGILVSNVFAVTTTDTLYACDKPNTPGKEIHKLNKADGTIISSNPIVISGLAGNVKGCTGLSQDPTTGVYYAIIQSSGGGMSGRILSTIDPETGIGTAIDSMDDAFSTLAFDSTGRLFAVGGAGANVNDELYSVDKTTAIVTPLCSLPGTPSLFNYLVYNWTDNVMYRLAGNGLGVGLPDDIHLDRINNELTCDVTTTSISGSLTGELFQASFNTNDQLYYILMRGNSGNSEYHSLTTNGIATLINASPFSTEIKGLAFDLSLITTLPDADGDGVPDVRDVCPGFDDNLDADGDGVPDGCDTVPITIVTANPTSGLAPLVVSFTCDSVTGNMPLTYSWDLDGDGIIDSTEASPFFTFDNLGDFTATCTVDDSDNDSNSATVAITIVPPNTPPIANDDSYNTDEDVTLSVDAASGVLFNDFDSEGDTLTVSLISDVTHGTLTLNPNGDFLYVPEHDYFGADSFSYLANDGVFDSNTATVSITINQVIDEPQEFKQRALDKIEQLKTQPNDKKTDKRLDKAIKSVEKSLDAKLWIDESHLDTKKGEKVFESEKKAVKELQKILDKDDDIDTAQVQMAIDDLCKADKTLAQIAIDDVNQPDNEKIIDANKKMDKAQSELDKNRCDKAIEKYKDAWEKTQDALKSDDDKKDKHDDS